MPTPIEQGVRRATILSIVALAVAVASVVIGLSRPGGSGLLRPGDSTPDHPFQYFKLTNNSNKKVKAATLTGKDYLGAEHPHDEFSVSDTLDPGQYRNLLPNWPNDIRYIKLSVTFEDGTGDATQYVPNPSVGYCIVRALWSIKADYKILVSPPVYYPNKD